MWRVPLHDSGLARIRGQLGGSGIEDSLDEQRREQLGGSGKEWQLGGLSIVDSLGEQQRGQFRGTEKITA